MSLDAGYVEYDDRTKRAVYSGPRMFLARLGSLLFARESRDRIDLLWGMPAILLFAGLVWLWFSSEKSPSLLEEKYRTLASRHFDAGQFTTAKLYLDRLQRMGEQPDELIFSLATVLESQGDTERAERLFARIAPELDFGYAHAHLRKAKQLLAVQRIENGDQARQILHHLAGARRMLRSDPELNVLFARYHILAAQPSQAVTYLKDAARDQPELYFDLGVLYQKMGEIAAAEHAYQTGKEHFEGIVNDRPEDMRARLTLGAVLAGLGQFEEAYRVLEEGRALKPAPEFVSALCQLCILKYDRLSQTGAEPVTRLRLLERALRLDGEFTPAINRLVSFGQSRSDESRQRAQELLEEIIASGSAASIAHLALGYQAWTDEDQQNAVFHFERAFALDPEMTVIANNLAYALAHDPEKPELERALELINSVIERYPDNVQYRETRGFILVKLNRWKESLDDLEAALPYMRDNVHLHTSLASAYANLNQQSLADKHRKRIKVLEQRRAQRSTVR